MLKTFYVTRVLNLSTPQCDCCEICFAYYITAVHATEHTAQSIKIEWPKPWPDRMKSNITGFKWKYSTQGLEEFVDEGSSSSPLDRSTTSAVLNNLQEGASYNITVIASPSDPTIQTETLTILAQTLPDSECFL